MYRIIVLLLGIVAVPLTEQKTAHVCLIPNNTETRNVTGELTFIEGKNNTVQITGKVYGLTEGLHGFHVHEKGDLQDGCNTTGAHFNPNNVSHGSPSNDKDHRHIGDLGNIQANAQGEADIHIRDALISLSGENSIVGRAVVVHSGEDDLGRGKDKGSLSTGNSGGRWACGIIEAD